MAPRRLHAKHRIIRPAPGKRPINEVYYEWSSDEAITANMREPTKEACSKDEEDEEDVPLTLPEDMEEIEFKKSSLPISVGAINVQNNPSRHVQENILPTPYHDLPSGCYQCIKGHQMRCVLRTRSSQQEVITLEGAKPYSSTGSSPKWISPPPSPKKET